MKNLIYAARPLALDLMSTLVFVGLSAATHNVFLATGVAVAAGASRIVWMKLKSEPVNALQWMSLGLVLVTGGATFLTGDPRYMMAKPSVIYLLVGASMMQRGWMLAYLPPRARELLDDSVTIRWGYIWAGLMFLTAVLNAVFAVTTSLAVWSLFVAVFPAASKVGLFAVHFLSVKSQAVRNARRAARDASAEPQGLLAA